ncbi:hypothetical protein Syun_001867 [Stephania yunnanensis]|uniref:Disease resistance N-terminal domain-containing protein n=1 Tax=Stephania yunnanensis TaxID=152371 RepID=A0AAP0LGJ0_9MAGN
MDFLPSPLQVLLENLVMFYSNENLRKLERTCLRVRAFVQEAKESYNQVMGDEAYKAWLRDLEDAAYDAEDLLDEIAIELSMRPEENRSNNNQARNLVLSSLKLTAP